MKLYHIDRLGTINAGQTLELQKNLYIGNPKKQECLDKIIPYYGEGLSRHGIHYLFNNELSNNNVMPLSNVMDIIFEYERMLNYSNKLSRYESFYAFDSIGVKTFIKNNNLSESFYKIYEVESDYYEKYNMSLISGEAHYNIAAMAKIYWENGEDPYNRPIINEYLLKFPIKIIREIRLDEID